MDARLTVVTWNINCGVFFDGTPEDALKFGPEYVAGTLIDIQADIVGLQEVLLPGDAENTSHPELIGAQAGFSYYCSSRLSASHLVPGASLGLAIMSRYPITKWSVAQLPNPNIVTNGPDGALWSSHDKGLLIANIALPEREICCICGHLTPFEAFSRDPAEAIFQPMWQMIDEIFLTSSSMPLLAMIDFNTDRFGQFLRSTQHEPHLTGLIRQPTRRTGRSDDQIVFSQHWNARLEAAITTRFDHHVCIASCILNESPGTHTVSSSSAPTGGISILHLSDLHFGPGTREDVDWKVFIALADREKRKDRLVQFLRQLPSAPDYVVVSGDITIAGHEEGFSQLVEIVDELVAEGHFPEVDRIIMVPGNHDVTRSVNSSPASENERWKCFHAYISPRFVRPWFPNHDLNSRELVAEVILRLQAGSNLVGGPSHVRNSRLGKPTNPSLPILLDRQNGVLFYAFNSAIVSGTRVQLPVHEEQALSTLRRTTAQDKSDVRILVDALDRQLSIDPARIDPRELNLFNEIINVLKDKITAFDAFTKIAILHHHVDSVIPEEVSTFESLINAGRFKFELAEAGFEVILHGHKHWPHVHFGTSADSERRRIIVSGGTIGGNESPGRAPGFFWLGLPSGRTYISASYIPLHAVGNPRSAVQNALNSARRYQLGSDSETNPQSEKPTAIPLRAIFTRTKDSLFRYLRRRSDAGVSFAGWSHLLDEDRISVIGTAYALLVLKLIDVQGERVHPYADLATETLWKRRNPDGGWSASSQGSVSRPEPTAFVLSALSKWVSHKDLLPSVNVLERMLFVDDDQVLWNSTYSLSRIAGIFSGLKPHSAFLPQCTLGLIEGSCSTDRGRPVCWNRQLRNQRGQEPAPVGSVVHTAHAVIALQQIYENSDGKFGLSPEGLNAATTWLLNQPSWSNTTEDLNRVREGHFYDSLVVKHYVEPWVLIALVRTGVSIDHPRLKATAQCIVETHEEGLWNWGDVKRPIWATHDALLAIREYCTSFAIT